MVIFNSYIHIKLKEDVIPPVTALFSFPSLSPVKKNERAFALLKGKIREAIDGLLEPAIYVMSADCGTGKGTTVQAILKEWKAKGFAGAGGAIIFVGTLAEVDAYKDGAALDRDDYAVLSPDPKYRTYGAGYAAAGRVPVLFVTHEKARRVLTGLTSFADATEFHLNGEARALRIWDEAFLPVQCASFSRHQLMALPNALRGLSKADIDLVDRLLPALRDIAPGMIIDVPLAVADVADRAFGSKLKMSESSKQTLDAVAKLAGSRAFVRGSETEGWRFIGIGRPMPADMGPLFVLDASARLGNRYDDWSAYGMDTVCLDQALIEYGPLNLHWWDQGCGKTILRNETERQRIYRGIAGLINSKPSEDFLLVMAKEFAAFGKEDRPLVPAALTSMLTAEAKVHVTTWGRHLGSNDHREVRNVILLGSWQYDDGVYEAISLASSGNPRGLVGTDRISATKSSEFMHNVYQAVCRIRVRNAVGSECSPANAYLIMVDNDNRREEVQAAFPGCQIESWFPATNKSGRKTETVLSTVLRMTEDKAVVSFKDVIAACGSSQPSYLTKVVKQERFIEALKREGVRIHGSGPGRSFIRPSILAKAA